MIRAFVFLVIGVTLVGGLAVGGNKLLAEDRQSSDEEPVTLRRFDDGSKELSYDLEIDQVLIYVVSDEAECEAYEIAGPGRGTEMMEPGTSVALTVTDPSDVADTRSRLLAEEC